MVQDKYLKIYDEGPKTLRKEGFRLIITGVVLMLVAPSISYLDFDDYEIIVLILLISICEVSGVLIISNGRRKLKKASKIKLSDSEISKVSYKLEQFKNMKIDIEDLDKSIEEADAEYFFDRPVKIANTDLKDILLKVKYEAIDKNEMLEWVNYIWFSDFFIFSDSVGAIMNDLVNIYHSQEMLKKDKINLFINKLEYRTD
ncbi:hypothetical protein [Sporosalibacterium faouarense]|uniref:hypothetical protein n=1 Tax=Sporosalibacterium faouarense TaxID=516123 RepID=UPI00192B9803|nr:hypothetical protein [Sporosalibacterium faouarense]